MVYLKRLFITWIVLSSSLISFAYEPSDDLINAFCSNLGPYSRKAWGHASVLSQVVENIKNNPACRGLYQNTQSFLQSINEYESINHPPVSGKDYDFLLEEYSDQMEVEKANLRANFKTDWMNSHPNASQSEIDLALKDYVPSSTYLTTLEDKYSETRLLHLQAKAHEKRDLSLRPRRGQMEGLQNLSKNLTALFGNLNSSTDCRHENSLVMSQMTAGLLGTIGSVYGGVVGQGLATVGTLVAGIKQYMRELKYNAKIEDIENNRLHLAFGCSLEGLGKTYCQARDTQRIIEFNLKEQDSNTRECKDCDNLFLGIKILSQSIHPYNRWIRTVLAGSSPKSKSQAGERISAFKTRENFSAFKEIVFGHINEISETLDQVTTVEEKNNILFALMDNLSSQSKGQIESCHHDSSGNQTCLDAPFKSSFIEDKDCGAYEYFFSKGQSRNAEKPGDDFSSCDKFVKAKYNLKAPHSLDDLRGLISVLFEEGDKFVKLKIQRVFEENPRRVLANFERKDAEYKSSPRNLIKDADIYLQQFLKENDLDEHPHLSNLIIKTLTDLEKVNILLREVSTNKDPGILLTDIGNVLAPKQQTFSFENTLREVLAFDLDLKIESGYIKPDEIKDILTEGKEHSSLKVIKNYLNVFQILEDTSQAKYLTVQNIDSLTGLFQKRIVNALKELRSSSHTQSNDLNRILGIRCQQLLIIPPNHKFWRSKNGRQVYQICKGSKVKSFLSSRLKDLSFNDSYKKDFDKRICDLYDFKRKLNLIRLDFGALEGYPSVMDILAPDFK